MEAYVSSTQSHGLTKILPIVGHPSALLADVLGLVHKRLDLIKIEIARTTR